VGQKNLDNLETKAIMEPDFFLILEFKAYMITAK
jgi:hypothetical protein